MILLHIILSHWPQRATQCRTCVEKLFGASISSPSSCCFQLTEQYNRATQHHSNGVGGWPLAERSNLTSGKNTLIYLADKLIQVNECMDGELMNSNE
jgi:hypothetical protein